MPENVITQAHVPTFPEDFGDLPEDFLLMLQGVEINIKPELFYSLPESILICLSANTIPQNIEDEVYTVERGDASERCINVDFSPSCFQYVVDKIDYFTRGITPIDVMQFKSSEADTTQTIRESPESDSIYESNQLYELPWLPNDPNDIPIVLKERPSLVVLKEDLEYYVFNQTEMDLKELEEIKEEVGRMFAESKENVHVFAGLKNANELNSPEYFLLQMLVLAGMKQEQQWDFRERKQNTARVLSMQIVPVHVPPESMIDSVNAVNKLLMFWRKPAKKCWWDKTVMEVKGKKLVVHCRRVWTLELEIIGLSNIDH